MRARLVAAILLLALVPAGAAAGLTFKATLIGATHTPKASTRWPYQVRATDLKGKPIRATVTVQVIDLTGAAHPVTFRNTGRIVRNWPFVGVFRDYLVWPAASRGFPFSVRAIVKAAGSRIVRSYKVTPR